MSRIPKEFQVSIPEERTAQYPANVRDESRLLVIDRKLGTVKDAGLFKQIVDYIAGDLVVVNNTRVIPARVAGFRPGGGRVEVLFISSVGSIGQESQNIEALIKPGRRLRPDQAIEMAGGTSFHLISKNNNGKWLGKWVAGKDKMPFTSWLEKTGMMPLPPYIRRSAESLDFERYQTTYATQSGSLAAPTAGLHFTSELISTLKGNNCDFTSLTLDVGLGTFLPIRSETLASHSMHQERYEIPVEAAKAINQAKKEARNVTVTGTTVVRALEDVAKQRMPLTGGEGIADLFIYPPFKFEIIERLITNFHRPDSTLLQLVAAFIGWELLNEAYQTALDRGFRFYSYGDAMLIV